MNESQARKKTYTPHKLLNIKEKGKILKTARKKKNWVRTKIRLIVYFPSENTQGRIQWSDVFFFLACPFRTHLQQELQTTAYRQNLAHLLFL